MYGRFTIAELLEIMKGNDGWFDDINTSGDIYVRTDHGLQIVDAANIDPDGDLIIEVRKD
jgi:hypothetical protein